MHVDGDQRLEHDSLELLEILGRLVDERVEEIQEALIGRRHDLLVVARVAQRLLRVTCPDHLDA